MRIGCLQFAPEIGNVCNNLDWADAILDSAKIQDLDLLVLPELAFTGSGFKSLEHVKPCLETQLGITSAWAKHTALKYDCVVIVGFPEKMDTKEPASPIYYNSSITVDAGGEAITHYRKSFLNDWDKLWASEGPDGFFAGEIPALGNVVIGIGTDLNPCKIDEPWTCFEFAHHILRKKANIAIVSMAWTIHDEHDPKDPKKADLNTLKYWMGRLEPLTRVETTKEIIVVFANRCRTDRVQVNEEGIFAGTSCVLGIKDEEVKVYDLLGHGEEKLLVVDTTQPPARRFNEFPVGEHSTWSCSASSNTSSVSFWDLDSAEE